MSGVAEYEDDHDAATMARLLDPVSLEARLAAARVRREAILAARAAPDPTTDPSPHPAADPEAEFDEARYLSNLPALAMRGAGVIVSGLAGLYALVAAGCLLLAPDTSAPDAFLLAAAPPLPTALPSAPAPGSAGWTDPASPLPLLAALAPLGGTNAPAAPLPADAASRIRIADAGNLAAAAPVLKQAAASSLISVASRSAPTPALFPLQATDSGNRQAKSVGASARRDAARRSARSGLLPDGLPDAVRKVVRDVARDLKRASAQAQHVARSANLKPGVRKAPPKQVKPYKARPGKATRGKSKSRGGRKRT